MYSHWRDDKKSTSPSSNTKTAPMEILITGEMIRRLHHLHPTHKKLCLIISIYITCNKFYIYVCKCNYLNYIYTVFNYSACNYIIKEIKKQKYIIPPWWLPLLVFTRLAEDPEAPFLIYRNNPGMTFNHPIT